MVRSPLTWHTPPNHQDQLYIIRNPQEGSRQLVAHQNLQCAFKNITSNVESAGHGQAFPSFPVWATSRGHDGCRTARDEHLLANHADGLRDRDREVILQKAAEERRYPTECGQVPRNARSHRGQNNKRPVTDQLMDHYIYF
ncbi:hypothetical protein quinque_008836 [Culex quinquefasciatus]